MAFIPVSILCAFVVKYYYDGEGLLFDSDSILVIIFGHIPEEFLGLILTPIWFVKDIVTKNFNGWKILDYCLYWMEIIFFGIGLLVCL